MNSSNDSLGTLLAHHPLLAAADAALRSSDPEASLMRRYARLADALVQVESETPIDDLDVFYTKLEAAIQKGSADERAAVEHGFVDSLLRHYESGDLTAERSWNHFGARTRRMAMFWVAMGDLEAPPEPARGSGLQV